MLPSKHFYNNQLKIFSNVLVGAYAIHSLKTNLRANKPAGVTDADLDVLFELYEEKWVD